MALRHILACALCVPVALAALVDCNSAASSCAPQESRPAASACPATQSLAAGSAPTACATDADCTVASSSGPFCLAGACGLDVCLSDGDCNAGTLCACAAQFYGGNALHGNACVSAACRVDADCGGCAVCAPSRGYCGGFDGFHCVPANAGACGSGDSCQFVQEAGRFECQKQPICAG